MDVEFGARADAEYLEALVWYLERGLELAERFATEVERVTVLLEENPRLWAEVEPGVRRALLHGFPYSLIFTIESDRVFVLAVAHQKRDPEYWRDRK